MDRRQNFKQKGRRIDFSSNIENKENINPLTRQETGRRIMNNVADTNNEVDNDQWQYEQRLDDKFKLLRRKIQRPLEEDNNEIMKNRNQDINLIQRAKREFWEFNEKTKYSFKVENIPLLRLGFRQQLKCRQEKKILLTIIKSNVNMMIINKTFIITERGIDCSQKTYGSEHISVGRQQVNEQGIRPNDIMLFPTDPSISRSHFKIYHKDFFDSTKDFNNKLFLMQMLSHPRLCRDPKFNKLNSCEVFDIMKYLYSPFKIGIEDNGTIYGTYVRIKPFSLENFLNNFFAGFKYHFRFPTTDNKFLTNFSFPETVENFNYYDSVQINKMKDIFNYVYKNKINIVEYFNQQLDPKTEYNIRRLETMQKFIRRNCHQTDKEVLSQSNFIMDKFTPAVFLNNQKFGFNVLQVGNICQIIEALKKEYLAFNGENFNPMIELISIDRLFDFQKLDPSSQVYKASISKEELVFQCQYEPILRNYSVLLFIETSGDPCGVMNRCNDVLFFMNKEGVFDNKRSFSFNFVKGFIVGNSPNSCHFMNSETDTFIYYNSLLGNWMISDLTKFTNPAVFYSEDYFGLWMCISRDKQANSRYTPSVYFAKSDDEIKASETIMRLNFLNESEKFNNC